MENDNEYKEKKAIQKIEELDGRKINMSREIRHFIYFQNPFARERYALYMQRAGFKILCRNRCTESAFLLVLAKDEYPHNIIKDSMFVREKALEYDGQYDGWEADTAAETIN